MRDAEHAPTADQSPQALLREAAVRIETALVKLDTRTYKCLECGAMKFVNFAHGKAYRHLTDLPDRLRRTADDLDMKERRRGAIG